MDTFPSLDKIMNEFEQQDRFMQVLKETWIPTATMEIIKDVEPQSYWSPTGEIKSLNFSINAIDPFLIDPQMQNYTVNLFVS